MIRTRTWTRVRGPSSSAPQGSVRESSEDRAFALGANDVLIQVEHTAVDLHDWHQRASSTSSRSCGYVRAVGSQVTTVAQGDSVVVLRTRVPNKAADHTIEASPATPPGRPETGQDEDDAFACGLTDVMLASEDDVKIVPLGLSARELLLLMRPGLAALDATHTKLRIFPGQSVLICGASSPIAYLAIQLALVKGARVLAVVATKEEAAALSSLDLVSCTVMDSQTFATADELRTTLLQATEELGFEHVLQCGSPGLLNWTHDIPTLLSSHGCWVVAPGYSTRSSEPFELGPSSTELLRRKNATLSFVNMDIWSSTATQRGMLSWHVDHLMSLATAGVLRSAPAVEVNAGALNTNLQRGGLSPCAPARLQMLVNFPEAT